MNTSAGSWLWTKKWLGRWGGAETDQLEVPCSFIPQYIIPLPKFSHSHRESPPKNPHQPNPTHPSRAELRPYLLLNSASLEGSHLIYLNNYT